VLEADDKVRIIKNLEATQARQKSYMITGGNLYSSKWGIMCTSRSHPQKVFQDLGLRENWPLAILGPVRSRGLVDL
jgi:hypothetical protein